jgi:hypothetical protein
MNKFNVGDMVKYIGANRKALTNGLNYTVIEGGNGWVDVNGNGGYLMNMLPSLFELVVPNELQVGETYTSYNGESWVAIYEEDALVWMKFQRWDEAYVFNKDGTSVSMGSTSMHNINWEATKGPIIEEGVFVGGGYHLSVHPHSLSCTEHKLSVNTVDGVPDWTTLACKEIN